MPHRLRLALVVLLAVLAHAPSLGWGFFCDDHGILMVLEGEPGPPSMRPWNVYDFGGPPRPGDPHFELGTYPWWIEPEWEVRFLRPVTSLAWMAEQALLGRWAVGYHLAGLAWFAAFLVLSHALFRALGLGPRTALLATLLLGLEDGGVFPVGWPANLNTLVEAVLFVAAALAVARPVRVARRHVALALALALGATLAKESGVAAFPMVAVILGWRARGSSGGAAAVSRGTALGGAACAGALAAAYLAFYVAAGFGATCAFYPTPWGDPVAFVRGGALLLAAAPIAMSSPIAPEPLGMNRELALAVFPFAALVSVALVVGAWRLVRRAPRLLPFVALTLLTLAPQAGAPTSHRLLFLPMVGFAPLLAILIERWWLVAGKRRLAARALALSAALASGLSCVGFAAWFGGVARDTRSIVLDADVGPPSGDDPGGLRDVIPLNSPTEFGLLIPVTTWRFHTGDETVRWWPLQLGRRALRWTRTGAAEFELAIVDPTDPPFGRGPVERVLIADSSDDGARIAGRRYRTALFEVAPVDPAAGLRTVRFAFERSLDDPSLRFVAWDGERLARIAPPAIGATIELAAIAPLVPLMP